MGGSESTTMEIQNFETKKLNRFVEVKNSWRWQIFIKCVILIIKSVTILEVMKRYLLNTV